MQQTASEPTHIEGHGWRFCAVAMVWKFWSLNNGQFYEVDLINNLGRVLNPIPRFPVKFRCAIFAKSTRPKNPSPNPKIFSVEDSIK